MGGLVGGDRRGNVITDVSGGFGRGREMWEGGVKKKKLSQRRVGETKTFVMWDNSPKKFNQGRGGFT